MGRELLGGVRADWQGESVDIERPPPCVEEAAPLLTRRKTTEIKAKLPFWASHKQIAAMGDVCERLLKEANNARTD